tara:strand:+ start:2312 stop:3244 length:933 start_codon:yes stop_codon:yes gene_type:complete
MNNTLCVIIIIALIIFIYHNNNTYEGLSSGDKNVRDVLNGDKNSCPTDETNPTYTYSAHIKPPSQLHMTTHSKSLNKNLSGLSAYTDVLTKGKGKATKKKKVIGGRYFTSKGVDCWAYDPEKDACTKQTSKCYTNQVPDDSGDQGLIPGLISDLNILSSLTDSTNQSKPCTATNTSNQVPACTKVVLNYATDNCFGYGAEYLLNSDVNNLKKSDFYKKDTSYYSDGVGGKWGSKTPLTENYIKTDSGDSECKITESFTPLNPEIKVDPASIYKNYYTELSNNDPVKQAFILIIGLGGLYWLHQLMYPKKR